MIPRTQHPGGPAYAAAAHASLATSSRAPDAPAALANHREFEKRLKAHREAKAAAAKNPPPRKLR